MTTSGTFNFSPNLGEIIMDAYDLIGVRRTAVLQEEMLRGRQLSNYWLSRLGNLGPNLWTVDLQSVTLIQGTPTYTVPPETVMVLDMYIETVDTGGNITDRNISPLNRSDYASLPNKLQQGQTDQLLVRPIDRPYGLGLAVPGCKRSLYIEILSLSPGAGCELGRRAGY